MCLYPRLMKNPKYKGNNKNGGNIPAIPDPRVTMVPRGCGNCMECLKQKQTHWKTRLIEDIKEHKNGKFITLTFNNSWYSELSKEIPNQQTITKTINGKKEQINKYIEGYELDNQIATLAVRRFLERWRKKFKKSVRHFLITEIGHNGTENIHLHGVLWTDELPDTIRQIWQYGYIWPKYNNWNGNFVSGKTISYIAKYITKRDFKHKHYKPIILTSAGIGACYTNSHNFKINKYIPKKTNESYILDNGKKTSLPIYYRNKIYSEEEREKLWLEKLDKQERWINGQKIDISKGEQEYLKILSQEQEKNKQLGYGTNKTDWEQLQYENTLRKLKQLQRKK